MRPSPRIALVFASVIFGILVLPGLFAPQYVATSLGLSATGVAGDNELRAVYGGLAGGVALFFALASFRPAWHTPGLVAQLCVFGGLVIARAVSIATAGSPGMPVYSILAVEALGAVAALIALRGMSTPSAA